MGWTSRRDVLGVLILVIRFLVCGLILVNSPPVCYLLSRVILKLTLLKCLSIGGFLSRGLHLSMPCKGRGLAERKGPLL